MLNTPPRGLMANFHTKTITPPPSIPARAPQRLQRFQNRAARMTGPKEAPKPAQAKETIWNTEDSGSKAKIAPMMEMITRVTRATIMVALWLKLIWNTPRRMFSEMEEEAASS